MTRAAPWPSSEAQAALLAARGEPGGLFSDVDGTLSPIALTPDLARLAPGALMALTAATRAFAVVGLISGRDPRDLQRMAPIPGLLYIGNHGFERLASGSGDAPQIEMVPAAQRWRAAISQALAALRADLAEQLPGARFEDKGVTASIHVRQTADPPAAERAVLEAARRVARRAGLRVTRGRLIVELRPPLAMDKGVAIASVCRQRGLRGAIYLGDDHTDLDAFRGLRALASQVPNFHAANVAVLSDEAPPSLARLADVTVAGVEGAVALIAWLASHVRVG